MSKFRLPDVDYDDLDVFEKIRKPGASLRSRAEIIRDVRERKDSGTLEPPKIPQRGILRCPLRGKVMFDDLKTAILVGLTLMARNKINNTKYKFKHAYLCPVCTHYHLTSQQLNKETPGIISTAKRMIRDGKLQLSDFVIETSKIHKPNDHQ